MRRFFMSVLWLDIKRKMIAFEQTWASKTSGKLVQAQVMPHYQRLREVLKKKEGRDVV
ncbi:hypothetical protein [Alteromonas sp. AMM-1]|uniref:hypothetical protein n=1 Tax=Alteromonas sp. AMM-1 TaxID=3394233 RepID=UPI0039A40E99